MNNFDRQYLRITRIISEAIKSRSGIEHLIFKFYDYFGECKYVLQFKTPKGSAYVPPSLYRLTDEFIASSASNDYDLMNQNFIRDGIDYSIDSFFDMKDAPTTRTRAEIAKTNPSFVGNIVDKEFDYYMFELVSSTNGSVYAWGTKGSDEYHIGEDTPGVQTKCPGYGKLRDAERAETTGERPKYELHIKDDNGTETYVLPFTPTGEYSFTTNQTWKLIDRTPIKDLKNKKGQEFTRLKKWLNDMIWKVLDQMLTVSDNLPPTPDNASYPLTQIDGDFYFNSFELWKDGKVLCSASKGDSYIKIG